MERSLQKMDLAVFLALAAGKTKVGEIAEQCGHSAFRIREALKRLQDDGLVERPNYRSWQLAEGGHAFMNDLWIGYVRLFSERPEAHEMIASTIAEAHKLIVSDGLHNDEAHELIVSSARNDRFNGSSMHVNDHACMDDDYLFGNRLAGSGEAARDVLEEGLYEIGFDQPGRWLQKEDVSWELTAQWLEYVNNNNGIRNKAGFIRRQVEAGERPNLRSAEQPQVPKEYEDVFLR